MKKKIKDIYYSEELPELKESICYLIFNLLGRDIYNKEWEKFGNYLDDFYELNDPECMYISKPGYWSEERLNLICLLIHSLELED